MFSQLKKAPEYKVQEWLEKKLELTNYQKSKLYNEEIIRFSPFYFYERKQKEKISILWRFTLIFFPFYFS